MNCSYHINTKELIQNDRTVIETSICKRFPEEFKSSLLTSDVLWRYNFRHCYIHYWEVLKPRTVSQSVNTQSKQMMMISGRRQEYWLYKQDVLSLATVPEKCKHHNRRLGLLVSDTVSWGKWYTVKTSNLTAWKSFLSFQNWKYEVQQWQKFF